MRTIAIINQKGGCGKTTISINLAAAMAAKGYRTLLADMDPQSHCAVGLAVPEEQIEQSIYDVMIGMGRDEPMRLNEVLWQICERLELAPSSIDLAAFEQQMAGVKNRENCLKRVLDSVKEDYDYVIVDCPPSVGLLTFNALRAATDVIVPVEMGYFSLHGLSKQLETLNILCKQCDQQINVMVLGSMYDIRTKMGREILAELKKHFSGKMFKTVVNFNTKLKEAASLGQPISEYDPSCKGYKDFLRLADELIGTDTHMHRSDLVNSLHAKLNVISASAEELLATIEPKKDIDVRKADIAPIETTAPAAMPPAEVTPAAQKAETVTLGQKMAATLAAEQKNAQMAKGTRLVDKIAESLVAEQNQAAGKPAAAATAKPKTAAQAALALEEKLADFYGVKQVNGQVVFSTMYPRAKEVKIAGDFNSWQPEETTFTKVSDSGKWELRLPMEPGTYRYRLVVDGQWQQDPYNRKTEMNPYGEMNSVLNVT